MVVKIKGDKSIPIDNEYGRFVLRAGTEYAVKEERADQFILLIPGTYDIVSVSKEDFVEVVPHIKASDDSTIKRTVEYSFPIPPKVKKTYPRSTGSDLDERLLDVEKTLAVLVKMVKKLNKKSGIQS